MENSSVFVVTIGNFDSEMYKFVEKYRCDVFAPSLIVTAVEDNFFDPNMRPYYDNAVESRLSIDIRLIVIMIVLKF